MAEQATVWVSGFQHLLYNTTLNTNTPPPIDLTELWWLSAE